MVVSNEFSTESIPPSSIPVMSSAARTLRVLVVEDDEAILAGLCDVLRFGGYLPLTCGRGDRAVTEILETSPDLVLLDVMLPGRDGFEVLREVRRHRPTLPVVMLTARGGEDDRVRGLDHGADDYVVKPFSAREVLARVAAVLRRSAERPSDLRAIRLAGGSVDLERREAVGEGRRATISEREAALLRVLASGRARVIGRDELLREVWGVDPRGASSRAVDMQVVRLRETLATVGLAGLVETVRGKGYRLHGDAEPTR